MGAIERVCVLAAALGGTLCGLACSNESPKPNSEMTAMPAANQTIAGNDDPAQAAPNRPGTAPMTNVPAADGAMQGGSSQPAAGEEQPATPDDPDPAVPADGIGTDGRIVAACQGFPLEGLQNSPGGDVLPNKCAPFHPWTNNPYAVRCIEAMPYETPYLGDDYCILPPPPELGMQLGVHPQTEGYWDAMHAGDLSAYTDGTAKPYELAAGDETLELYDTTTALPQAKHFYRFNFRGRYGSHHSVSRFVGTPPATAEGWRESSDFFNGEGTAIANLQRANVDVPPSVLQVPAEEQGIAIEAPAGTSVTFQLHHFNTTDKAILREVWMNVWWVPENEVERAAIENFGYTDINYPPGQVSEAGGVLRATEDTQLLSVFGHRHAWTTRIHVWLTRAGSSDEQLIYDSYNWMDVPTYAYNSVTENPAPDAETRQDGGYTGPITLHAGDALNFNCRAEVTAERAAELGVDLPTEPLRFSNQAFASEMCIATAVTAGTPLSMF